MELWVSLSLLFLSTICFVYLKVASICFISSPHLTWFCQLFCLLTVSTLMCCSIALLFQFNEYLSSLGWAQEWVLCVTAFDCFHLLLLGLCNKHFFLVDSFLFLPLSPWDTKNSTPQLLFKSSKYWIEVMWCTFYDNSPNAHFLGNVIIFF